MLSLISVSLGLPTCNNHIRLINDADKHAHQHEASGRLAEPNSINSAFRDQSVSIATNKCHVC